MKFHLAIENFLAISLAEIDLSGRGLLLIQGDNQDNPSAESNGAGKSSVPDALYWALTGETARGVSGDAVINRSAGKNCRVVVKVTDEKETYEIARHRKHTKGKNSVTVKLLDADGSGREHDLTKGTDKLTQEVIFKILGCSAEVFKAAVYSGQEQMPDLPGMTDKQLKLLVEEAAGINQLQAAHDIAKKRLATAEAVFSDCLSKKKNLGDRLEDAKSHHEGAKARADEWDKAQGGRIADATNRAKEAVDAVKRLDTEIAGDDLVAKEAERDRLQGIIDGVAGERVKEVELRTTLSRAQAEEAKAQVNLTNAAGKLRTAVDKLKGIDAQIGKACGECGRNHDESTLGAAKCALKETAKKEKTSYDMAVEARAAAGNTVLTSAKSLETFTASMTDISEATASLSAINASIVTSSALRDKRKTAATTAKSLVERQREIKAEINPHLATITDALGKIDYLKVQIDNADEEIAEQAAAVELRKKAVQVYGPAGVRAHILDTVTPFLNDRTAHYLGALSDGNCHAIWQTLTPTAKGELREKFSIDVADDQGAESFAGLSGGEKRKVRLATALALQDLVGSRAAKPIDLWIGDEIDDALDNAGLERLMNILELKARERGTVLVISHADLKDWIRETLTVVKKGGVSTVVEGD